MEQIANDSVVSIHYTLRDDSKAVIDSSSGSEPLIYLHGHGQIIPGLEKALVGKRQGDKVSVTVAPADGYGDFQPELVQKVDKRNFPAGSEFEVGNMFEAAGPDGDSIVIRITEVEGDTITVDGNHPLAGKELFFDVEVVGIRPATESELEHGHAHSGDGHHHEH